MSNMDLKEYTQIRRTLFYCAPEILKDVFNIVKDPKTPGGLNQLCSKQSKTRKDLNGQVIHLIESVDVNDAEKLDIC